MDVAVNIHYAQILKLDLGGTARKHTSILDLYLPDLRDLYGTFDAEPSTFQVGWIEVDTERQREKDKDKAKYPLDDSTLVRTVRVHHGGVGSSQRHLDENAERLEPEAPSQRLSLMIS